MTKEETIQVLQSIEDRAVEFPNMTECDWVAIAAAKRHLQEPVSEELEVELKNYLNSDEYINTLGVSGYMLVARHFAKWQEAKDKQVLNEEGVVVLPEEAFERMKRSLIELAEKEQQMMAKVVDGVITFDYYGDDDKTYGCIAHDSFCLEDFGLKDTDKVKMILIKEE